MSARERRTDAMRVVVCALALATVAAEARADAWREIAFTSPAGKTARGFATDAIDAPGTRLVVGCEQDAGDDRWRGVAVLEPAAAQASETTGPTTREDGSGDARPQTIDASVAFFARAPVTERWQTTVRRGERISWPALGDALRRSMLREDATRAHAAVTITLRDAPEAQPRKLVFGVGGLEERGRDLAATCDGWGASTTEKRRERGW
jgi:hypothetical protein